MVMQSMITRAEIICVITIALADRGAAGDPVSAMEFMSMFLSGLDNARPTAPS